MKRSSFAGPYLVWMALFIIVPFALILFYAGRSPDGAWTAANFLRFLEPVFVQVLWRSVWMALLCTLFCLLIGYPAALFLSDRKVDPRGMLIVLFLIPMWMNFLLRTYAWLTLLENSGLITATVNRVLALLGRPPVRLLYTSQAVMMGMVYNYLPFMVLPIFTALSKLDRRLIEAAEDLGANAWQVFTRVVLPLSLPGVVSGVTMVFMPAITTFVISRLLGGAQYLLFGDLIEQQFLVMGDWNFGSALSVIMMALILLSMSVLGRVDKSEGGGLL